MGPVSALKKGFEVAGKNWGLIVVLFLLNFFSGAMGAPLNAVQENTSMGMIFLGTLTVIFFLFLSIFIQAGLLGCIKEAIKSGQTKIGNMVALGKKYFLRLLGLTLLIGFIVMLFAVFSGGGLLLRGNGGGIFVKSLGMFISILFGVLAICAAIVLFYAPYILVVDDCPVIASMRKSIDFIKRFLGNALGTGAVVILVIIAASILLAVLLIPLASLTGSLEEPSGLFQFISNVLGSGLNAYLGIVGMTAFMNLYVGLAAEKEQS